MVSGNLALRTQTAPLYVFARFEAGNVQAANAVAAVLTVISFGLFFSLLRFTRRKEREV
jgi:ABC-type sulfate transport system permease component